MDRYIEEHLLFIKPKLSPANFNTEKYMLPNFRSYLESQDIHQWHEVTQDTLETWLTHLTCVKKNSVHTKVRKIHAVRRFFQWMVVEEHLLNSPIDRDFYQPKVPKNLRPSPTPAATLQALDNADASFRLPHRNRAILELAYSTALRRSELQQLNVHDVEVDELRVIGKGDKERLVPLGVNAKKHVMLYINTERQKIVNRFNPREEALFVSQNGGRLCLGAYNSIMRYQVKSKCTLHSFRHACATHMLHNGANIRAVQKLLGHEKLSTTQDYTRVETGQVKEMLDKYHPRG